MIKNLSQTNQQQIAEARIKAQNQFKRERAIALSQAFFPEDAYHPEFKTTLQKLLKFNNKVEMDVVYHTWNNMCTFSREFIMIEMDVCFQILIRATPFELCWSSGRNMDSEFMLKQYNDEFYPQILKIVQEMSKAYFKIDLQISKPIADRINADAKISLKMPIGTDIKFVIPDYKWGQHEQTGI